MSGLTITTAPQNEPLDAAETISYLRVDSGVDTTLINNLIKAARFWAEDYTNRTLLTTVFTLSLDAIGEVDTPLKEGFHTGYSDTPRVNYIELPRSPVQSVTSIKSFSDDNTATTLAASNYFVDSVRVPARVVLRDGGTWPTDLRNANGIEVLYTAGYGDARSTIPEPIRIAMLEYVTHLYEHRGDDEGRALNPPALIKSLLQPYVIMRYGVSPFNGGAYIAYR
jgi:uncharacterized phiE125 gp8 family phage protein|tara:strand:+ start:2478 stop:3149 length:672 start_codon:yes stop_codon:yes gene_type:complete